MFPAKDFDIYPKLHNKILNIKINFGTKAGCPETIFKCWRLENAIIWI